GRDRRPGQPAGCRARRGDRRRGAFAVGALPAAGRAVRHLLRHCRGAGGASARALQSRRAEEDMSRDRTVVVVLASLVFLIAAGVLLPQWAMFILTVGIARGLVVLGLLLLLRAGLVSFGQALFYCLGAYAAGALGRFFGISDIFVEMLVGGAVAAATAFVLGFLLARYRGI